MKPQKKQLVFFQNKVNQLCAATLAALCVAFITLMSYGPKGAWVAGLYAVALCGGVVIGWLGWLTTRILSQKPFSRLNPQVNRFIDMFNLCCVACFAVMCVVPAVRTVWVLPVVGIWWAACMVRGIRNK